MPFERPSSHSDTPVSPSALLGKEFRDLSIENAENSHAFEDLVDVLQANGFAAASENDLATIFYDNTLLCRSEQFTKVIDLLSEEKPIALTNTHDEANMCLMTGGEGFKTAMSEGFSGKDVGGNIKVVITFNGGHLNNRHPLAETSELWKVKPSTARVSLIGDGGIALSDLEMVSFRFPAHRFPSRFLTDAETERLDQDERTFIVRHYISQNKKTTH